MKRVAHFNSLRAVAWGAVILASALPATAERPKVIKAVPDNGDKNVDPNLKEIRVEFDQDMNQGGFSWVGGGEKYPKTRGKPRWTGPRVCVLPVRLEPNHEYWLSINSHTFTNFKSKKGEPAVPYPIHFWTGAGAGGRQTPKDTPEEEQPAATGRPTVIKAVPDNGDTNVDPDLKEIRVEFDQDMNRGGYSWVGGGETYPKTRGRPRWISPRVCVLPVELEPDHEYWLSINSHTFTNFKSAKGEPAVPYPIHFWTSADSVGRPQVRLTLEENRASISELRRAIMEDYSHRDRLKVDWPKEFSEHTEKLEQAETPAAFAREAGKLLEAAQDLHLWLEVGKATFASYRRRVAANVNLETLAKAVPGWAERTWCVATGRFEDGIGYIMIRGWPGSDHAAVEPAFEALDELADTKALIIDVRTNGGGDELLARKFAGCFLDSPRIYAKNVSRAVHLPGGFTPVHERLLSPTKGRPKYRGKVVVLMGPANMSSCEAFLMMMKQVPNCTLIGQKSYGSSGNPKPTALPNGVTVYLPSWKALQPDDTPIEGVGIEPDVRVRALQRDFTKKDPVLEAALKRLRR